MDINAPVGLSGQIALARRLETIASNVANAGTAGYKSEAVTFATVVSKTQPFQTSFAFGGGPHVDLSGGGFKQTGNPLDVAVRGQGFLAIATPQGAAYTRDGRMQMLPTGDIVTLEGHAVLDAGGAPLTADPDGGALDIGNDGTMRQNGRTIGALGLFTLDFARGYSRYENSAFIPAAAAVPVDDFARDGIVQGFVEESNVNPVLEMTRLIAVQRAFEAMSASLEQRDQALRETIQGLGARGG
ncbi:flagellar basal-body rod protein FlgF [Aestuariivirga sp.]|uniref:flagellar basal-body rod protein FlgF n=1 Tax=Aestuariivirga sp. TaxID=2650926 RepID=UPI0025BD482D|nr:flagellar basal-body rod protein FlgF [Aestuariivirga sp.]MCA3554226.1 flagellar basal-body rod protein FlgF [Aestuariivirga sp.]